jgi:hypothetical protein
MPRNKYIRISVAFVLLLLCVSIATPRIYLHSFFGHDHSSAPVSSEKQLNSQTTDDCDFENYNKPAYFNIFRFISNFIPVRPSKSGRITGAALYFSQVPPGTDTLRGPPARG